jgi:hypothetical protein
MTTWGRVTIECDSAFCRAEIVIDAENLWPDRGLSSVVVDNEWAVIDGAIVCSHCIQEKASDAR